ncbi:MAG: type II secretion system protein, partial [Candidatus Omnitrophota bacterium]
MLKLRTKAGFTLVEIMIVVAIISLLAAIAIPNLLRARHNANETAAIGAIRTISTACESFRSAQTPTTYPATLGALSGALPPYIDAILAAATAAG